MNQQKSTKIYPIRSIDEMNNRINQEICYETINKLSDKTLMSKYKISPSLNKNTEILKTILDEYINDELIKKCIIDKFEEKLIPAGCKGNLRGQEFNKIVEKKILNMNLNESQFEIKFEQKCEIHFTSEIPDWYILDKISNKIIIGMNQLDIWRGGAQKNRGDKYLNNDQHNTEKSKLLCVIANEKKFNNSNNDIFKLFQIGFTNNTLCYIKNLENIIIAYFNLI